MPQLYIISGCNGAGKTTASYTVLPEMLNCHEFVNVDEIALELSPVEPEKVAIRAGRIMLAQMKSLIYNKIDFAFETTLSPRSYVNLIREAKLVGFHITLLYFWLNSVDLAVERVKHRVLEGGHDVAVPVIQRRYNAGLINLFERYIPICDYWMIFDKSNLKSELITEGFYNGDRIVKNNFIFEQIERTYYEVSKGARD